jgi:hypothetical protein
MVDAHIYQMLRLNMCEAIPPLSQTPAWCSAPSSTGMTLLYIHVRMGHAVA